MGTEFHLGEMDIGNENRERREKTEGKQIVRGNEHLAVTQARGAYSVAFTHLNVSTKTLTVCAVPQA